MEIQSAAMRRHIAYTYCPGGHTAGCMLKAAASVTPNRKGTFEHIQTALDNNDIYLRSGGYKLSKGEKLPECDY